MNEILKVRAQASTLIIINNKSFMLRGMLCYISISNGLNLFKVQNDLFMCNI